MMAVIAAAAAGIFGSTTNADAGVTTVKDGDIFVITKIAPGSEISYSGGQIGSLVTRINDRSSGDFEFFPENIESLQITGPSSTESAKVVINVDRESLIQQTVSLLVLAGIFAVMSMFVFIRAERTPEVVLFAFFTAAAAATLAIGPASISAHPWARLVQGSTTAISSVYFTTFFFVFARNPSGRQRIPLRNLPEISTLIALLILALWLGVATVIPDQFLIMRDGTLILLGISFLTILILLPWRYRHSPVIRKEQLRIATVGTVVGLFPFVWLSIIPLVVTGNHIIEAETTVLGLALIPLSFGYSILRYQLLGISRLVHRSATYILITAVIVALYGSVLTVLSLFTSDSTSRRIVELILLIAMFVGVPLIAGVRNRAVRIADRILYPQSIDRENLIGNLNDVISTSTTPAHLAERTLFTIGQGLGLEYAFASGFPASTEPIAEYGIRPASVRPYEITSRLDGMSGINRITHGESDFEFLAGITRGINGVHGNVVLGPRIDGAPFDGEDIRLFQLACSMISGELVRSQLALAVESQQHELESIGEEVQRIQEYERAELSSYLHDEPLQKIAYALGQIRERALPEDLAGVLEDVARDLRTTSASLSPDILKRFGLTAAVGLSIEERRNRSKFQIFSEMTSLRSEDRFSEDVELAIYRTIQEGLNNAHKHSQAKAVWVRVSFESGFLIAQVDDNGIGLQQTDGKASGVDGNLGIRSLERRINQLGGGLKISPRASRGTSLYVRIPATRLNVLDTN